MKSRKVITGVALAGVLAGCGGGGAGGSAGGGSAVPSGPQPLPTGSGHPAWRPAPGGSWQWQLSGRLDLSVDAATYDVDGASTPATTVAALHRAGRHVVCYVDAGAWEPYRADAGAYPAAVRGRPLDGFPDQRWLDVRRLDVLAPILDRRFDDCRAKGFDAVEADDVDGYEQRTGFDLTGADQLRFDRWVAAAVHARGMSVALKNDLDQAPQLEPDFDFALLEQCVQYAECGAARPFVAAGKAVLDAEYRGTLATICPPAGAAHVVALRKDLDLDASRQACPSSR